jgi:tripartite-type tricarboxylate transporter receptor subunit TctC
VLKAPDLRDKLSVEAVEPMLMSPEQFGRYITEDVARWSRLAQSRGIQLDG